MLLNEVLNLKQMLLENRVEFLKAKFLPILKQALLHGLIPPSQVFDEVEAPDDDDDDWDNAVPRLAEPLFDYVLACDPDPLKKNSQWLLTIITRKNSPMPTEDLEHAPEVLTKFAEMKKENLLPPDKTDINAFRSLSDLNATLRAGAGNTTAADDEQTMLHEAKIIYDGDDYRVLVPLTMKAACYFGRNTDWCTAYGDHKKMGLSQQGRWPSRTNQFDSYDKIGSLYIVEDKKTHELWQFCFDTFPRQFMDSQDREINIREFFKKHPKIKEVFQKIDIGQPFTSLKIDGKTYQVYRKGLGFEITDAKGILGNTILKAHVNEDNSLYSITTSYLWRNDNITDERQQAIIKLLNDFKIVGYSKDNNLYPWLFYRNGKWGSIKDVGETIYSKAGLTWKRIVQGSWISYALIQNDEIVMTATVGLKSTQSNLTKAGDLRIVMQTDEKLSPELSHALTDLILQTPEIKKFSDFSTIEVTDLTKDDQERLVRRGNQ